MLTNGCERQLECCGRTRSPAHQPRRVECVYVTEEATASIALPHQHVQKAPPEVAHFGGDAQRPVIPPQGPGEALCWDCVFEHNYEALEPATFITVLTPKRP